MKSISILILLSFLASVSSWASGAYFQIGLGISEFPEVDTSNLNSLASEDKTDISLSLILGKQFNSSVLMEVGYHRFGEYAIQTQREIGGPSSILKYDLHSFSLALVSKAKISDALSIFGKLGWHKWEVDGSNRSLSYIGGVFDKFDYESLKSDGDDLFLGLGWKYIVNRKVDIDLNIMRYDINDFKLDNVVLGLNYKF